MAGLLSTDLDWGQAVGLDHSIDGSSPIDWRAAVPGGLALVRVTNQNLAKGFRRVRSPRETGLHPHVRASLRTTRSRCRSRFRGGATSANGLDDSGAARAGPSVFLGAGHRGPRDERPESAPTLVGSGASVQTMPGGPRSIAEARNHDGRPRHAPKSFLGRRPAQPNRTSSSETRAARTRMTRQAALRWYGPMLPLGWPCPSSGRCFLLALYVGPVSGPRLFCARSVVSLEHSCLRLHPGRLRTVDAEHIRGVRIQYSIRTWWQSARNDRCVA